MPGRQRFAFCFWAGLGDDLLNEFESCESGQTSESNRCREKREKSHQLELLQAENGVQSFQYCWFADVEVFSPKTPEDVQQLIQGAVISQEVVCILIFLGLILVFSGFIFTFSVFALISLVHLWGLGGFV